MDYRLKYDYDFKICPIKSDTIKMNHKSQQIILLKNFIRVMGRKVKILPIHIDDEDIYCEQVRNLIENNKLFNRLLEIQTTNDMNLIKKNRNIMKEYLYDIVIMDRDLGFSDFDGLEVLKQYVTRGTALLCLHSNRTTDSEITDIKDIVDCILPKPVGEEQMLNLLFDFNQFKENFESNQITNQSF